MHPLRVPFEDNSEHHCHHRAPTSPLNLGTNRLLPSIAHSGSGENNKFPVPLVYFPRPRDKIHQRMGQEEKQVQTPRQRPMDSGNQYREALSNESGSQPGAQAAEEPYSIFDKRQKAIIVVIVSLAATCTWIPREAHPDVIGRVTNIDL